MVFPDLQKIVRYKLCKLICTLLAPLVDITVVTKSQNNHSCVNIIPKKVIIFLTNTFNLMKHLFSSNFFLCRLGLD